MREYAYRCPPGWTPGGPSGVGSWFALPLLSLLRTGLVLLGLAALVSLLATGSVLGVPLPAGLPVWACVLGLFVLYHFLAWPLKALRRACYWSAAGGPFCPPPAVYLFDSFVGIGCAVLLFWLAVHHLPLLHEACRNVPSVIHEAADTLRSWWARQ